MSEQQIEQEIQDKGLNAPRLTPDHIDAQITGQQFFVFPGTTVTICLLTLRNGFTVTGESACASPENFNEEIGRKIAREQARDKIWALEGYLLKEKLHTGEKFEASFGDNCVTSQVHGEAEPDMKYADAVMGANAESFIPHRVRDDIFMLTQVLSCQNVTNGLQHIVGGKLEALINKAFPDDGENAELKELANDERIKVSIEQLREGKTLQTDFGEDGNLHPVKD